MAAPLRKYLLLAVGLLAAGGLRLPLEARWSRDFERQGLLIADPDPGTMAKMGQTLCAVALGGLRTLVATVFDLRAVGFYEDLAWDKLADTYEIMFALAPRTAEYWSAGAHHQAYNAASYYRYDESLEMSPALREAHWRASVQRGRDMLERGIRNLPDNPDLHKALGALLSDPHRHRAFGAPDATFEAAAEAYRAAADCPDALPYLRRFEMYSLARVPHRGAEALELAERLYANPGNRLPTLCRVYFALQVAADAGVIDPMALAVAMFGSEDAAYRELSDYWLRGADGMPMDGVALVLRRIEAGRGISDAESVFRKETRRTDDERAGGRGE